MDVFKVLQLQKYMTAFLNIIASENIFYDCILMSFHKAGTQKAEKQNDATVWCLFCLTYVST